MLTSIFSYENLMEKIVYSFDVASNFIMSIYMPSINEMVLLLLSISTLLTVAGGVGLLPSRVSKHLNRNKLAETLSVLNSLGINPDKYERINVSRSISAFVKPNNIQGSLDELLKICTINEKVSVGKTEQVEVSKYIDVMSMSTNPEQAEQLARHLTSYWKFLLSTNQMTVASPQVDLIVTPKGGSPILGYEFAKIMDIPFALHVSDGKKFHTDDVGLYFNSVFDSNFKPQEGAIALIVDDSATGGRKVMKAIEALQKSNIKVTDCLVLFELTLKGVKGRLKETGVNLHSIVKR